MLDASFKTSSSSMGYIGFSFLLHSGLIFMLATASNWRDIPPPGTTEWTEISVISDEPPPLGNTPVPVLTDLPPTDPATAQIEKEMAPTPETPTKDDSAVVIAKKETKAKEPAPKKEVAKASPPPPPKLPEKEVKEEAPPAETQEESPVVAAVPVETPPPSNQESLADSEAYQEFQKDQLDDANSLDNTPEGDPFADVNKEVDNLENQEALLAAASDPNLSEDSESSEEELPKTTEEAKTEASALANNKTEKTQAPSELPAKKDSVTTQNTAVGGRLGLPEGTRLNTDLRQHPGNVPPVYPALARQSGWEGTVALTYDVSPEGQVRNLKVARSSGYQVLDREAIRAISRYRYLPGQQGQTFHPVTFRLTGPAQASPSRLRTSGASIR